MTGKKLKHSEILSEWGELKTRAEISEDMS